MLVDCYRKDHECPGVAYFCGYFRSDLTDIYAERSP